MIREVHKAGRLLYVLTRPLRDTGRKVVAVLALPLDRGTALAAAAASSEHITEITQLVEE